MSADYGVKEVKTTVKEKNVIKSDSKGEPFTFVKESSIGEGSSYGIRVATGSMSGGGTHITSVYVRLIGNRGDSGNVSLTGFFSTGVSTGTFEDLLVETERSLGEVQVVIIGIKGALIDDAWFVEYSTVYDFGSGKETRFPCYHWIKKNEMVTTTSKATTCKDVQNNPVLIKEREDQLEKRKNRYQWQLFPDVGLPSGIDDKVEDLPDDEEFGRVKNVDFTLGGAKGLVATQLAGITVSLDTLESYAELYKLLDQSPSAIEGEGRWKTDLEFGRQMMNAVNPVVIKKCTAIPSNFAVTDDLVKPFLTRGKTLTQEIEDGNVFICDMKIMDGLPTREGQFCAAPICLLYVNSKNELVPIAIQLKQEKDEENNPVFIPSDDPNEWLLAKTFYQSAHAQHHQLVTHYMSCHATMEAYAVATMRNLPDAHPINKLLRPHFRYTMAINSRARAALINTGGIIDRIFAIGTEGKEELWRRAAKEWSVDWTNIEKYVKERGVEDLPGYYYRDDGVKIFRVYREYATDVINAFYDTDKEVASDTELQAWAQDMVTNAFPANNGATPGRGFPSEITTKEELAERCTVIMFTGSSQHASINFGQYSVYGFVPNAPASMRNPPPSKKGEIDEKKLLETLPDEATAKLSITTVSLLSEFSRDEVFLGNYPFKRFTENRVQRYIERVQKKLEGIHGAIITRNKDLDFPYTFMEPTKIPNSITI